MAPAAQPSPLFWCSKYTAGGFGGAPGFGGLEGVEVQDPSLPCVFSNSYTAPVLHSLPQPALSDKLHACMPGCGNKRQKLKFTNTNLTLVVSVNSHLH